MITYLEIFICIYLIVAAGIMFVDGDLRKWNPKKWEREERCIFVAAVLVAEALCHIAQFAVKAWGVCGI